MPIETWRFQVAVIVFVLQGKMHIITNSSTQVLIETSHRHKEVLLVVVVHSGSQFA
jgi:hypothetical protein